MDAEFEAWLDEVIGNTTNATALHHNRKGIIYDRWPFRLDIAQEYQDWILVVVCSFIGMLWLLPCICGKMHTAYSRRFTECIYTRLHVFYWGVLYLTMFLVAFTVGILPDWTVEEFSVYLGLFFNWMLRNISELIQSGVVIFAIMLALKFKDRIIFLAGMEHITIFRFSLSNFLGIGGKQRPVELHIWKVEGLQSASSKLLKANDVFVECHLGFSEPMRTRVHNNAGSDCILQEALQFNIDESQPSSVMTLLVKDQKMMASTELARLMLSTRELLGIEEQTGKKLSHFEFSQEHFVQLDLSPMGKVWVALSPVEDWDDHDRAALQDDNLLLCC